MLECFDIHLLYKPLEDWTQRMQAVQAMRFVGGLAAFLEHLEKPEKLQTIAETLAFGRQLMHTDKQPDSITQHVECSMLDPMHCKPFRCIAPSQTDSTMNNHLPPLCMMIHIGINARFTCFKKRFECRQKDLRVDHFHISLTHTSRPTLDPL